MFASLDWLPTFVEIAGGPKGDELKKQIKAGKYPGIVKTKLDGVNQLAYLDGKSEKSARDYFFYYSGSTPSAVRYKNWKFYYTMMGPGRPAGSSPSPPITGPGPEHQARSVREERREPIKRRRCGLGGALASPSTAYIYDWNMLPIGQLLWEKELMSYTTFPPLQAPATYNLDGILEQMKEASHPSD